MLMRVSTEFIFLPAVFSCERKLQLMLVQTSSGVGLKVDGAAFAFGPIQS
jgi:hypothetical protein